VKIVYFTHSLRSCWNHGNAHFLRGVLRELQALSHEVAAWEPEHSWSLSHLLADHGAAGLAAFHAAYPDLRVHTYAGRDELELAVAGADAVIVHEWNEPWVVAALAQLRRTGARFTLLFHDTHHRAVSEPDAIARFDLDGFDGVLAFGEALAAVYRRLGWGQQVHVWHEAADTRLFRPPPAGDRREGLVWIGNWGDGERSEELLRFLLRPAMAAGLPLDIHGVRYPESALRSLAEHGAIYRGWLPNAAAPSVFARHLATVHVPRRFYVTLLPGIPTIRVFEALACGIPLVSAPWQDTEALFRPGEDFLIADTEASMTRHLRSLREDAALRSSLAGHGLDAIARRHSCGHRAVELVTMLEAIRSEQVPITAGVAA
jgi:spore maturation protein CgeB